MAKIAPYRALIEAYLTELAATPFPGNVQLRLRVVFDHERDQYLLLTTGHYQHERVHRADLHLAIEAGKVCILENNTDWDVLDDLHQRGIPSADLLDALLSPKPA